MAPAAATAPARRLPAVSGATYEALFAHVHAALVVNLLLAVATSPLLLGLAVVVDPLRSWPFFLVLALCVGPAVAAAFGCWDRLRSEEGLRPVRDFLACYRRTAARALAVWGAALAVLGVLAVDVAVVAGTGAAGHLVPLLVVLAAGVLLSALTALAALVRFPGVRTGALVRAAVYATVRRWAASAVALALLGVLVVALAHSPLLVLPLLPAPVLFVVWSGACASLAAVLPQHGRP
ncbi:uncharacterized protein DUF624 [Kineococcus xinjiangensis]|uniref:Uncharacterized protein DUF624 n=1 Tax=Kineococcus xinjiangensis TaxID=512762 RepID=A0A2S6IE51_9ACTN|nr:DUF624 domain-containing protein [Kineococcus xinjiangensis]PPK92466.1 uncharacterized protein DUF624 [Kineococcus xinjiangensis]